MLMRRMTASVQFCTQVVQVIKSNSHAGIGLGSVFKSYIVIINVTE